MVSIENIQLPNMPVILAPMEDITDASFRLLCKKYGANLMYSEFISSEGLIRDAYVSTNKIAFYEEERPFGIQIFGNNVESMVKGAQMATELGPDLIDLNFGCPVKKIVTKNQGAALLKDIPMMIKITEAVVKSTNLPVTAKTRLGWDDTDKPIVEVAERLQDAGIRALTIHGRTRSQLYSGKADWSLIREVKNNQRMHIPIFGNGDIKTPIDAKQCFDDYHVDGIMIGRAAIGNPRLFAEIRHYLQTGNILPTPNITDKIEDCRSLLCKSVEIKGEKRAILEGRKHYSNFFKSITFFKPYKLQLMEAKTLNEIEQTLDSILEHFSSYQ